MNESLTKIKNLINIHQCVNCTNLSHVPLLFNWLLEWFSFVAKQNQALGLFLCNHTLAGQNSILYCKVYTLYEIIDAPKRSFTIFKRRQKKMKYIVIISFGKYAKKFLLSRKDLPWLSPHSEFNVDVLQRHGMLLARCLAWILNNKCFFVAFHRTSL